MLNPTKGANWLSRALVLGFTCVAITVVAHAVAGGTVPLVGVAAISLLMVLGALFATARELSMTVLTAFLAGSQVVCHLLLNGFSHSTGVAPAVAGTTERGAHALHAMTTGSPEASAAIAESSHGMTLGMLVAHAVACLAAVLVLREGERVMFSLHRALPNIVRVLFGLIVPARTNALPVRFVVQRAAWDWRPRIPRLDFVSDVSRRGPPTARCNLLRSETRTA